MEEHKQGRLFTHGEDRKRCISKFHIGDRFCNDDEFYKNKKTGDGRNICIPCWYWETLEDREKREQRLKLVAQSNKTKDGKDRRK